MDGVYKSFELELPFLLFSHQCHDFLKSYFEKYVVHVSHVFLEDLFVQNSFPSGAMSAPLSSAPSHEPTKLQWPRVMTALLRSQYPASSLHVWKYKQ
jgi:hypothetical protein